MKYDEVLKYIKGLPPFIPVKREDGRPLFDLKTVSELARRMGDPQEKVRCVHIAGTNGKGSTAEFLSEIMIKSGYKTGLFTSPYLENIREQTRVNSSIISKEEFAALFSKVIEKAEEMKSEGLNPPSEFEMDVVMSFMYFCKCKCDICIIEAGLGGEFDATNIIQRPELCIFTPVSLDHTAVLGDDVKSIASIKAGIIKSGCECLTAKQDTDVLKVIKEAAEKKEAALHMMTEPENVKATLSGLSFKLIFDGEMLNLKTKVTGAYQAFNAALAVSAAQILKKDGFKKVNAQTIKEGLLSVRRPGRFDVISSSPVMIADGAHNPGGVKALLESLKEIFPESYGAGKGFIFVIGVLADKDHDKMFEGILPHIHKAFTVTPPNVRALPAAGLAKFLTNKKTDAIAADTVENGVNAAKQEAVRTGKPVVILGSLYYMGEVLKRLR